MTRTTKAGIRFLPIRDTAYRLVGLDVQASKAPNTEAFLAELQASLQAHSSRLALDVALSWPAGAAAQARCRQALTRLAGLTPRLSVQLDASPEAVEDIQRDALQAGYRVQPATARISMRLIHQRFMLLGGGATLAWLKSLHAVQPLRLCTHVDSAQDLELARLLGLNRACGAAVGRPLYLPITPTNDKPMKPYTRIVAGGVLAASLAACSSTPPRPDFPDGSTRVPVNQENRIAVYQQQAAEARQQLFDRDAAEREKAALLNEVAVLRGQVNGLRDVVRIMSTDPRAQTRLQSAYASSVATAAQPATPGIVVVDAVALADRPTDPKAFAVDRVGSAIVLRAFMPFAVTEFVPSPAVQAELMQAIRAGQRFEVTGYTDSEKADAGNEYVAQQRAANARRWLMSNGVSADRITVNHRAAGHFLVANEGKGKGLNRRAEIVVLPT